MKKFILIFLINIFCGISVVAQKSTENGDIDPHLIDLGEGKYWLQFVQHSNKLINIWIVGDSIEISEEDPIIFKAKNNSVSQFQPYKIIQEIDGVTNVFYSGNIHFFKKNDIFSISIKTQKILLI